MRQYNQQSYHDSTSDKHLQYLPAISETFPNRLPKTFSEYLPKDKKNIRKCFASLLLQCFQEQSPNKQEERFSFFQTFAVINKTVPGKSIRKSHPEPEVLCRPDNPIFFLARRIKALSEMFGLALIVFLSTQL